MKPSTQPRHQSRQSVKVIPTRLSNTSSVNPIYDTYIHGLAPSGRKSMTCLLNRCAGILLKGSSASSYPWQQLTYAKVARLRAALLDTGYALSSVNMALSALKGLCQTAFNMRQMDAEELARIKSVKRVRGTPQPKGRSLSRKEIQKLVDTAKLQPLDEFRHRDRALLLTACGAGLRASELVSLQLDDFEPVAGCLIVRCGKGRKYREVYLAKPVTTALKRWIKHRGPQEGALFNRISRAGSIAAKGLTTAGFSAILERLAKEAEVAPFSPHDLRRTFITKLLEQGNDLNIVRQLAGHADIATTARYDRRGDGVKQRASRILSII